MNSAPSMLDAKVRSVMAQVFGVDESAITGDASVQTVDTWDSLRHMHLIAALEREFSIRVPDADVPRLHNFQDICRCIHANLR